MAFAAATTSRACSGAWPRTSNTCATGRSVSISQFCCGPSRSCGRTAALSEEAIMNRSIPSTMLGVVLLGAALAGCGNRGGGSQVVAKVGESEITISQLSQALHAKGLDNAGATATREAVDSLVNEQILVDGAV